MQVAAGSLGTPNFLGRAEDQGLGRTRATSTRVLLTPTSGGDVGVRFSGSPSAIRPARGAWSLVEATSGGVLCL